MKDLFYDLLNRYGYQNWWPLTGYFDRFEEVCIGAVLTQNTSWKNVEKAIQNLIKSSITSFKKISETDTETLASIIKPAGFYNQKAKTLKRVADFVLNTNKKDITRKSLLNIKGIGKETADTILLYGLDKKVFVVDAYTKRLFYRLGYINNQNIGYDELQKFIQNNIPQDLALFKEFHALIVEHCKNLCKKKPICEECFLNNRCYNYSHGK